MRRELAKRVAVFCLTVAVVVAVAGAGPAILRDEEETRAPATPEYDPATVVPETIPAMGTVNPDPAPGTNASGTVLIDRGHSNRFSRATIEPLVDALVRQGYTVEFYTDGDLAAQLEDADAFLVIDPGAEYLPGDVQDVREFTGNGGRLVMVGEPDRTAISIGLLGTSIQTQESRLTSLASHYGMSVDTRYLYNQQHADGTFKHIVARPTDADGLSDIDRTTMYTAAAVTSKGGTVLLRSAPKTHKSGSDSVTGEYPVAVQKKNALLLGDKTFLRGDRFNVADNEKFIAYVVEFMIEGEHRSTENSTDGSSSDSESSASANDTVSVTVRSD
ncbi:MAG: DUF4350 domain-containing protein [Haloplanus sp.]